MPWARAELPDGHTYEVRHTTDAGFKARPVESIVWTTGSDTLVGALREAFEGKLDDRAEREIRLAAARLMEQGFSNIPANHRGQ